MKAALFGDYNLATLNRDDKNHENSYTLALRVRVSRVCVFACLSLKLGTIVLAVYIPRRLCQIHAFKIVTFFILHV